MFFLELSCVFNDPADVGNLISGSSAFSKTRLNIWKFTVHVRDYLSLEELIELIHKISYCMVRPFQLTVPLLSVHVPSSTSSASLTQLSNPLNYRA